MLYGEQQNPGPQIQLDQLGQAVGTALRCPAQKELSRDRQYHEVGGECVWRVEEHTGRLSEFTLQPVTPFMVSYTLG